ncbi:hypothetical protein Tco_0704895, partial [Tanacetum coccineum]
AVLLRTGKVNITPARPQQVPTGKPKEPAPVPTGRQNRPIPVPTDRGDSPSVTSGWWQISTSRYVVPTGRVVVPTGRYVVPASKVIIIFSPGRLNLVPTGRVLSPGSDNDSDDASIHGEATIPQQQRNTQPQIITTVSNNNAKFPYLKKDNLKRTGRDCDGRVIILPPMTGDEHIAVQRESKARTTLLQSILDDHVADFHYMDDVRDIWNAVKARFGGNAES